MLENCTEVSPVFGMLCKWYMSWRGQCRIQCFKRILLTSKQVKNLYKWTTTRRWEMEYLQWMVNIHSQKTNVTDSRQSRKSFGIIDKSECFSYNSLIFSKIYISYHLHTTWFIGSRAQCHTQSFSSKYMFKSIDMCTCVLKTDHIRPTFQLLDFAIDHMQTLLYMMVEYIKDVRDKSICQSG